MSDPINLKMNKLDGRFIVNRFEKEFKRKFSDKRYLFIVLGLLGDFDSFEYIQSINKSLVQIKDAGIELFIVGIGNDESKKRFCEYTKLPCNYIHTISDSNLHDSLFIEKGLKVSTFPLLNLILMCMGIGSPGTLCEVLRGYIGDCNAKKLFKSDEFISIPLVGKLELSLFNYLDKRNVLRPFELATLRLLNMIEVLSNWQIYMINYQYLTQRTATFIVDEELNLLYDYYSKGLLGYSENMSEPLEFIDNLI